MSDGSPTLQVSDFYLSAYLDSPGCRERLGISLLAWRSVFPRAQDYKVIIWFHFKLFLPLEAPTHHPGEKAGNIWSKPSLLKLMETLTSVLQRFRELENK